MQYFTLHLCPPLEFTEATSPLQGDHYSCCHSFSGNIFTLRILWNKIYHITSAVHRWCQLSVVKQHWTDRNNNKIPYYFKKYPSHCLFSNTYIWSFELGKPSLHNNILCLQVLQLSLLVLAALNFTHNLKYGCTPPRHFTNGTTSDDGGCIGFSSLFHCLLWCVKMHDWLSSSVALRKHPGYLNQLHIPWLWERDAANGGNVIKCWVTD